MRTRRRRKSAPSSASTRTPPGKVGRPARIIKAYRAITKPKLQPVKHEPHWYAWWALDNGLEDMQRWAKDVIQKADAHLKELECERR
jgi:hypothetical protein